MDFCLCVFRCALAACSVIFGGAKEGDHFQVFHVLLSWLQRSFQLRKRSFYSGFVRFWLRARCAFGLVAVVFREFQGHGSIFHVQCHFPRCAFELLSDPSCSRHFINNVFAQGVKNDFVFERWARFRASVPGGHARKRAVDARYGCSVRRAVGRFIAQCVFPGLLGFWEVVRAARLTTNGWKHSAVLLGTICGKGRRIFGPVPLPLSTGAGHKVPIRRCGWGTRSAYRVGPLGQQPVYSQGLGGL